MNKYDLVIIGAGASGLSAGISALKSGIKDVLILEKEDVLGGNLNLFIDNGFGEYYLNKTVTGPELGSILIRDYKALEGKYKLNTRVLEINRDKVITYVNPEEGIQEIEAKAIILAAGCREKYTGNILIPIHKFTGIFTTGSAHRLVNYNGYPKQSDYQSVIGYEYPDWIWGWTNTVTYKNFTLSFTLDGRVGGMAHSKTNQAMWNSGAHIDSDNQWRYDEVVNKKTNFVGSGVKVVSGSVDYDSNGKIIHDNRVFAPNDVQVSYESYMKSTNPYIGTVTRQNVFDETFFKLRDLSLSYQMPKSVCDKLHMKGLTLAFVGQNLFVWTKEFRFTDPDSDSDNLSSPSTRYLGFNVKLDF